MLCANKHVFMPCQTGQEQKLMLLIAFLIVVLYNHWIWLYQQFCKRNTWIKVILGENNLKLLKLSCLQVDSLILIVASLQGWNLKRCLTCNQFYLICKSIVLGHHYIPILCLSSFSSNWRSFCLCWLPDLTPFPQFILKTKYTQITTNCPQVGLKGWFSFPSKYTECWLFVGIKY